MMDRLAHDALTATNALRERHDAPPLDEWTATPPGLSPVELAIAQIAGVHDVCVRFGQVRWQWSHGVHTHWTPPPSVANFITDWDAGKYPDLVAAGPF